ncbi:MAG: hypothetical protein MUF83_19990 [Acidimicrobiales bacterium]|nr:hypothetical protein [Acidimicrobiales bacterium]
MHELEPVEPHLRAEEVLDPSAHLVVRGWPLTVEGLLANADATRSRYRYDDRPLSAVSAEVTVAGWSLDAILSGPRLATRRRYAAASVDDLIDAGFGLLATFRVPHYSIVLEPYTPERAEQLLEVLGEVLANPYYVRRQR